ncbi:MAG: ribonuclease PH [Planctomycetota bacterium]|nr:ribonuclease PH [Planctomycetota bacterium]MCB9824698.1 ribonuclease PH [Planctomycetota bacterium]MCB9899890.1 ribonuclease PH [Planctomycetota bacterium]
MTSADAPRHDGRRPHDLRGIEITRGFTEAAPGSVLYRCGRTLVFVTASIEERVPGWMMGRGKGWLTAEYSMLPGSGTTRKPRDRGTGRVDGRTHEIQRLVGRALRSVTDLAALGERTVWLDCDVLQADGGTRTACINAAYVALCDALKTYAFKKPLARWPVAEAVGAISVGVVNGQVVTDLDYHEDHRADVDMNVVMTASGRFLEVQGTGEARPFDRAELDALLEHGRLGVEVVIEACRQALAAPA